MYDNLRQFEADFEEECRDYSKKIDRINAEIAKRKRMKKPIEIALGEMNTKELVGNQHNPEVLKYFHETGSKWVKTDETAWCSAFLNWVFKTAGLSYSGKLNARSWLKIGKKVKTPKVGDVVIFWRVSKNDWRGHVGMYVYETANYIHVLGGNQNNKVCIKPYAKHRLLGYRRIEN